MRWRILVAGLIMVSVCGVSALSASASTTKPTIDTLSPSSGAVAAEVTIEGTNLAGATEVTFNGTIAVVSSDTSRKIKTKVPVGATTGYVKVKTSGGTATSPHVFKVDVPKPLENVLSVVSDSTGYCALLTSGEVDCWGDGSYGQLGNGTFYRSSLDGSATPVAVEGVGGTGSLAGVTSLVAGWNNFCAILASSSVDCWGYGGDGQLGNGTFYPSLPYGSATPVAVEGVGGTGSLAGVTSLVDDSLGYCALLTSGGVDCWGDGQDGQLGNGTFYTSPSIGSATPVAVEGVGGTATLTGVKGLVDDGQGYCTLLTSGSADCWGDGIGGALGNGTFSSSAVPVAVEGVGGTGTLTGVASLVSGYSGDCALLISASVDCWGDDEFGQLGNGTFSSSAVPVAVEGVGGTGTLTGVTNVVAGYGSYCALLASGGVNCWGDGEFGELGNDTFYTSSPYGNATPVAVEGVGATGTLTGVTNLAGLVTGFSPGELSGAYCALLSSGAVDCWGRGSYGELGNGTFSRSAVPVAVEGVGGTGTLTGVTSVVGGTLQPNLSGSYCALLSSGEVNCWGSGEFGELGDKSGSKSNTPVEVVQVKQN